MLKAKGKKYFATRLKYTRAFVQRVAEIVDKNPKFILVTQPKCVQLCFYFAPEKDLTTIEDIQIANEEVKHMMTQRTQMIQNKMLKRGKFQIDIAPLTDQNLPTFFRCVFNAPNAGFWTEEHFQSILKEIEEFFLSPL